MELGGSYMTMLVSVAWPSKLSSQVIQWVMSDRLPHQDCRTVLPSQNIKFMEVRVIWWSFNPRVHPSYNKHLSKSVLVASSFKHLQHQNNFKLLMWPPQSIFTSQRFDSDAPDHNIWMDRWLDNINLTISSSLRLCSFIHMTDSLCWCP